MENTEKTEHSDNHIEIYEKMVSEFKISPGFDMERHQLSAWYSGELISCVLIGRYFLSVSVSGPATGMAEFKDGETVRFGYPGEKSFAEVMAEGGIADEDQLEYYFLPASLDSSSGTRLYSETAGAWIQFDDLPGYAVSIKDSSGKVIFFQDFFDWAVSALDAGCAALMDIDPQACHECIEGFDRKE